MITNKNDSHIIEKKNDSPEWLQIKAIVTNDYKFSSNVNEVIKTNFLTNFVKKISFLTNFV